MRRNLDWRRIRLLGIAGLVALAPLVLAVFLAISPIIASLQNASDDAQLAARLTALAAEKPAYAAALAQARQTLGDGALYNAGSAELDGAALQNNVQTLVLQNGGQLSSSAITPHPGAHGLQRLGVSVQFSIPASHLPALLQALYTQRPVLVTQSLDMRSLDYGGAQGDVSVTLQVNAFAPAS